MSTVPVPAGLVERLTASDGRHVTDLVILRATYLSWLDQGGQIPLATLAQDVHILQLLESEPGARLGTILDGAVRGGLLMCSKSAEAGDAGARSSYQIPAIGKTNRPQSPTAASSARRANVFTLYEEHVGPLTATVADELREAESSYPRRWIEDAVAEAVQYNRRNWRYIQTILKRREETGATHGIAGRRT